jgi:hypothetical protein
VSCHIKFRRACASLIKVYTLNLNPYLNPTQEGCAHYGAERRRSVSVSFKPKTKPTLNPTQGSAGAVQRGGGA